MANDEATPDVFGEMNSWESTAKLCLRLSANEEFVQRWPMVTYGDSRLKTGSYAIAQCDGMIAMVYDTGLVEGKFTGKPGLTHRL